MMFDIMCGEVIEEEFVVLIVVISEVYVLEVVDVVVDEFVVLVWMCIQCLLCMLLCCDIFWGCFLG